MSHVKNVTPWGGGGYGERYLSPGGGGGGGRVSIFVLNIITGNMQQATHTVNGIKKTKEKA